MSQLTIVVHPPEPAHPSKSLQVYPQDPAQPSRSSTTDAAAPVQALPVEEDGAPKLNEKKSELGERDAPDIKGAVDWGGTLQRVYKELDGVMCGVAVPADHGLDHFYAVHRHAMRCDMGRCSEDEKLAIVLAALLHDVDDRKIRKYFAAAAADADRNAMAERILRAAAVPQPIVTLALEMIALVSFSGNGNGAVEPRWKLIPRDADRIEALGDTGVRRAFEYSRRVGMPFVTAATPLPTTRAALAQVLADTPPERYVGRGTSRSTLDHFYDKLLHMRAQSGESSLTAATEAAHERMVDWLLSVNRTLIFVDLARLGSLPCNPTLDWTAPAASV